MTSLLELAARRMWNYKWPATPWGSPIGPSARERREMLDLAQIVFEALLEPTDKMLETAAGALKAHIDALPAEVRAKSKEKGGVVFVGPLEKHAIRFRAMMSEAMNENMD